MATTIDYTWCTAEQLDARLRIATRALLSADTPDKSVAWASRIHRAAWAEKVARAAAQGAADAIGGPGYVMAGAR